MASKTQCKVNPQHYYLPGVGVSGSTRCPWCERDENLNRPDPSKGGKTGQASTSGASTTTSAQTAKSGAVVSPSTGTKNQTVTPTQTTASQKPTAKPSSGSTPTLFDKVYDLYLDFICSDAYDYIVTGLKWLLRIAIVILVLDILGSMLSCIGSAIFG